ncbi:TlpA family protein disulfide reductase [Singulisphaera rosea]
MKIIHAIIFTITTIITMEISLEGHAGVDRPAVDDGAGVDGTIAGRIAELKQGFEARDQRLSADLTTARKAGAKGGSKEIRTIIGQHARDWERIAEQVITLVRDHPADPASFDGLLLLAGNYDDGVLEIVRKHFLNDSRMGRLCVDLSGRMTDSSRRLLSQLATESPDRRLRGRATYALGQYSSQLHREITSTTKATDADLEQMMTKTQWAFRKATISGRSLNGPEEDRLLAEARGYFERVVNDYPDVTSVDGSFRLADKAKAEVARIDNIPGLRVGKVAPDIVGEDLDGKPLNLKDHRGKVVVLCFWATWCGPCMAMVPHERELVRRMAGKPFALIGINADEATNREKAKSAARDERMVWPSFWDEGFDGPIQRRYNVDHYPTTYVLDASGRIRYIDVRDKDLDRAIDALLSESGRDG